MRNFCRGKAYSRSYGDWENLSQCKLNVGILEWPKTTVKEPEESAIDNGGLVHILSNEFGLLSAYRSPEPRGANATQLSVHI